MALTRTDEQQGTASASPRRRPLRCGMRLWGSLRDRLMAFTALAGLLFVILSIHAPGLAFVELPRQFPTAFHERHGFFHVLRWLEHVHAPEDLARFLGAVRSMARNGSLTQDDHDDAPLGHSWATTASAGKSHRHEATSSVSSAEDLVTRLLFITKWEMWVGIGKVGLQWGLLLFLYRTKHLAKRVVIPCVCLGVLLAGCRQIAQSCIMEMVSHEVQPTGAGSRHPTSDARGYQDMMIALLGLLFYLRFTGSVILNGVYALAYQRFFGGWPKRWRHVPQYIGSKDFALPTLFYAASTISLMTISSTALRSLSEAALQVEGIALVGALAHFAVHHFVKWTADDKNQ